MKYNIYQYNVRCRAVAKDWTNTGEFAKYRNDLEYLVLAEKSSDATRKLLAFFKQEASNHNQDSENITGVEISSFIKSSNQSIVVQ